MRQNKKATCRKLVPVSLHFINLEHPSDATTTESLKQIRSHVAKDIHARTRRERLARQHSRPENVRFPENEDEDEAARLAFQTNFISEQETINTSRGTLRLRRIASKLNRNYKQVPNPAEIISTTRQDPFDSFVRPLSETEHFLLDHYISFVVVNGYQHCEHDDEIFFPGMRTQYVPFALGERGMLSTILLSACRSLLRLEHRGHDYNQLALSYKGHCIKTVNDALSQEGKTTSDATIGCVLSLAADDMFVGDTAGYCMHADALIRMVELRGGMGLTGMAGFLGHLLRWSVYNTKWRTTTLKPDRSGRMSVHELEQQPA